MNVLGSLLLAVVVSATNAVPGATGAATSVTNAATSVTNAATSEVKITSASVYYDRKEGFAYFSGRVVVNDTQYQLHADRAYVFMSGTNDVRRIVAIGHVAMTNGTKRAYGEKASYYRDPGKVILTAPKDGAAEVRDEADGESRVVRGRKIMFWTNSRQVEVLEAEIAVPVNGVRNPLKQLGM